MSARTQLAAACLLLVACASPGTPAAREADLGLAQQAIDQGDLWSAERALEVLFQDGRDPRRDTEVFWAGWLLAQAHADLALGPGAPGPAAAGAHVQAALGLDLLEVGLVGRMGFDERVARLVDASFELSTPGGGERLAREAGFEGPRLARLWLALFDYWSTRDVRAAFDLAVRVLEVGDANPGTLEAWETAALERWIRQGAGKSFRCPECRQPAVPELRACPNDQTPLARFYVAPGG